MQPQFLTGNSRLLILRTMKKLYWAVPAVLLLVLVAAFFLLPSQTVIFKKLTLPVSQDGMVKLLTTKEKWKQWWPGDQQELIYDSTNFTFQQQLLKTVFLHVPYRDTRGTCANEHDPVQNRFINRYFSGKPAACN
jgi:hypothetical protein